MRPRLPGAKRHRNLNSRGCFQDFNELTLYESVSRHRSSLRTLCPFFFFPFHSLGEVGGVQRSLAFWEARYFCFFVPVVRRLLAFRLPVAAPPCDSGIVCDPEHSWPQESCTCCPCLAVSMAALAGPDQWCGTLSGCHRAFGGHHILCWYPECLAGLSKKVSWLKAVWCCLVQR